MSTKVYLEQNVYEAARERMRVAFTEFDRVCVSFSNGKDSGVMLNLAIDVARELGKLPVHALYIDMEAQYQKAIEFTHRMFLRDEVVGWWVCLPIHLRNAVSQIKPYWLCWDKECQDAWVRDYPENKYVITDEKYFPFFRRGMEFEEFVPAFAEWFSEGKRTACMVGIRSDESLNRFRTIRDVRKITYKNYQYTTKLFPDDETKQIYNFYPLYDWTVKDIWICNGKNNYDYNKIYDIMHIAGVPLSKQRLCQPYGDDQRQGLYLFKMLEPMTWAKVVNRVEGANFGNRYTENDRTTLGNYKVNLPENHTYESYAKFLLSTMPPHATKHYTTIVNKFIKWWHKQGCDKIPDSYKEWTYEHYTKLCSTYKHSTPFIFDKELKDDFNTQFEKHIQRMEMLRKIPTWRRICKTLLKNDYWGKGLGFSQTTRELEKQIQIITSQIN